MCCTAGGLLQQHCQAHPPGALAACPCLDGPQTTGCLYLKARQVCCLNLKARQIFLHTTAPSMEASSVGVEPRPCTCQGLGRYQVEQASRDIWCVSHIVCGGHCQTCAANALFRSQDVLCCFFEAGANHRSKSYSASPAWTIHSRLWCSCPPCFYARPH